MITGKQSIWKRSPIVRFVRWLFSGRIMRPALKIAAAGAVVLVMYYGEEDWRGSRAWNAYLRDSKITAEEMDFHSFIPKPVPDDENFASIPIVKGWFGTPYRNDPFKSDRFSKAPPSLIQDLKNIETIKSLQPLDLVAWQIGLAKKSTNGPASTRNEAGFEQAPSWRQRAAAEVVAAMQDDETAIQSLRGASGRTQFYYPVNYSADDPWSTLLPHDYNIEEIAARLELKACAELAEGDSAKAFDDVMLTLYLADSLTNEPLVISYLVRARCVHAAVQPIWEGIAQQNWSDSQLQEMERRLLRFNFILELEKPLKTERAFCLLTIDLTKSKGVSYLARTVSTNPTVFGGVLGSILDCGIPSGWFSFEKVNYCRSFDILFADTFDPVAGTVSPLRSESNRNAFNQDVSFGGGTPTGIILQHRTVARIFLPTLPKVLFRAAIAQTAANEASLACALERYHLANGKYPANLQLLVPEWLPAIPHEVIGGQGYRYRLIPPNRFLLYSIGWDQQDHGGKPGEFLFSREGDWVWENPGRNTIE